MQRGGATRGAPAPAPAPAQNSVHSQTDEPTPGPSRYREASTSTLTEDSANNVKTPLMGLSIGVKRKSLFPSPSPRSSIHGTDSNKTITTPLRNEDSTKKPRLDNTIGSPFYPGQTMYGGASASRINNYMREPNIISRKTPIVSRPLCNDNNSVSSAVTKMMKLLENYSTPLAEIKREPQVRANTSNVNSSLLGSTISPSRNLSKFQELRTSHTAMMLNMKRTARLRDSTQAARQIYMSHTSTAMPDPTKSSTSTGGYGTSNTTSKIKSQVGRTQPRKNVNSLGNEIVPPLNLPSVGLTITSLPQFSFTNKQEHQKTSAVTNKVGSEKIPAFKFAKPIQFNDRENHIPVNTNKFTFRLPEQINKESPIQSTGGLKFSNSNVSKPAENAVNEIDWKCDDCWVMNKPAMQKCIACGDTNPNSGNKPLTLLENAVSKPTKSVENSVPTEKDWKCNDCWVMNKSNIEKCVACCGAKPRSEPKANPVASGNVVPVEKDWKCSDCWVMNKPNIEKCVACGGVKSSPSPKPLIVPDNSILTEKDWKCNDCWIINKPSIQKCVACGGSKPASGTLQGFGLGKSDTTSAEKDWKCNDCWITNKPTIQKCVACGGPKPSGTKPLPVLNSNPNEKDWKCNDCWVMNKHNLGKCVACGGAKQAEVKKQGSTLVSNLNAKSPFQNNVSFSGINNKTNSDDLVIVKILEKQNQKWECISCLTRNDNTHIKCVCCEAPKPGANSNEEKTKFNFSATPTFKFGIQPKTDTNDVVDANENKSSNSLKIEPNNNIGPKTSTPFSFGIPAAKTTTENKVEEDKSSKTTPMFSFGAPSKAKPELSKEAPKPFALINTNESIENKSIQEKKPASDNKFTFGVPAKSSEPLKDVFKLPENNMFTLKTTAGETKTTTTLEITPVTQNSQSEGKTAVDSAKLLTFAPATTDKIATTLESKSVPTSNLFSFSTPTKTDNKPAEVTTTKAEGFATFKPSIPNSASPLFSFNANPPKTTETTFPTVTSPAFPVFQTKTESSFTAPTTTQPLTSTAAVFSFGSNTTGATKPAAATPGRFNFSFGSATNSSTAQPAFNATFGTPSTATSNTVPTNNGPAMPPNTNLFGSPQQQKNILFGGITNVNNQKSDLTVSFGAANESKPAPFAFGAQSNTFSGPVFGTGGQQQSSNLFGAANQTQNPTNQSGGLFGSSAQNTTTPSTLFGGVQTNNTSAPMGMFGSPNLNAAPTFGSNASSSTPFGAPTTIPAFGVPNSTATPTFGVPNSTATPTFGVPKSTATSTFGVPNSTATPSFGGLPSTTPSFGLPNPSATPSFGASSQTTAAFGAQNVALPAFGAPTATVTPTFGAPNPSVQAPPPAYNFGGASTSPMFAFGQQPAAQPGFGAMASPNMQSTMQFNMGTSNASSNIAARRVRKAVRRNTPR